MAATGNRQITHDASPNTGAEGCGGIASEQAGARKKARATPRTARDSVSALLALIAPQTSPARPSTREHRAVATTVIRSPTRPAPVMGDSCRQVSWLAAPSASLPPSRRLSPAVALGCDARRLQLRGQPRI